MTEDSLRYDAAEYVDHFDPRRYLEEYYSMEQIESEDVAIATRSAEWLHRSGRVFERAIDFGCGPVLEYPFLFAPYVSRIDLADYLPGNLHQVKLWLDQNPAAFDWDPLFRGVLKQIDGHGQNLEARKESLRTRVGELLHCDLCRESVLDVPSGYDLITSFHCVECVAADADQWQTMMRRVFNLLRPGGSFFFSVMRHCTTYQVLGKVFPAVPLDVTDCEQMFNANGLQGELTVHDCPEFAEAGFCQIMLLSGTKQ